MEICISFSCIETDCAIFIYLKIYLSIIEIGQFLGIRVPGFTNSKFGMMTTFWFSNSQAARCIFCPILSNLSNDSPSGRRLSNQIKFTIPIYSISNPLSDQIHELEQWSPSKTENFSVCKCARYIFKSIKNIFSRQYFFFSREMSEKAYNEIFLVQFRIK